MKDFNSDSSAAVSRFAKDKRLRTTRTERVERGGRNGGEERPRRSSFNPHFTSDNRLKEGYRQSQERPRRDAAPYGERADAEKRFGGEKKFGPARKGEGGKKFGNGGFKSESGRGFKSESGRGFGAGRKSEGGKKFGGKVRRDDDRPKSYPKYNPNKVTGEIRLNRFVAQSGICSRREADDFISAGLVSVNGVIVTELGTKVKPTDDVRFNDERLQGEKNVYILLNKPKGYVTTLEDEHADKTVMELVKGACTERIYPVGRLDKNSLGLLLFTNDGDVTRNLTHPSLKKKKIYEVALDKPLTRADFDTLAEGVTLEDGEAYFDEISYLKDDKKSVGVEIHSGRNRIVRRMFEHLGYAVTKLDRVYYAGLTKKNLKRGAWRFLTTDEVNRLKSGRYE
ncbi:MAG: rRNA pseudouridine synthase [Alistipes sp.]|nr:rRNA pseudouridine synthase [Alistipes sp.]